MKTVIFRDDPLVHRVGAYNDIAHEGYVYLRTFCGRYEKCSTLFVEDRLLEGGVPTCVHCYIEPDWHQIGSALCASPVQGRTWDDPVRLTII